MKIKDITSYFKILKENNRKYLLHRNLTLQFNVNQYIGQ